MSKSAGKSLRLFVAVYPPEQVARKLLAELHRLQLPAHRLVAPEQVHLTLHFIGDTSPERLDATRKTVHRSTGGLQSFELTPQRLVSLPERRPRLVAAEADRPPVLLELQRRLVSRLARTPRRPAGDRFRPHFTLCRLKTPAVMPSIDEPVVMAAFHVGDIVLVRSTLDHLGAQHDHVESFSLT